MSGLPGEKRTAERVFFVGGCYGRCKKTHYFPWPRAGRGLPLYRKIPCTGWVRNEYDGTVLLEIQGSEYMINKLLMGLNHNQFITIEWMDTEELPLDKAEMSFSVR